MPILAIETATSTCAVTLFDADAIAGLSPDTPIIAHSCAQGRAHAEQLLPMIAALPNGGRADVIVADSGPGSFTGIRIGVAAARALAFGWGITAYGYSSLALLAAGHRSLGSKDLACWPVINGGHGELFIQPFSRSAPEHAFAPTGPVRSLRPEAIVPILDAAPLVGGTLRHLGQDRHADGSDVLEDLSNTIVFIESADGPIIDPDSLRWIDKNCYFLPLAPHYRRDPDAKPNGTAMIDSVVGSV